MNLFHLLRKGNDEIIIQNGNKPKVNTIYYNFIYFNRILNA